MSAGWQNILPKNLNATTNAAGNGTWFQLVTLDKLITAGQAKLQWVSGNASNNLVFSAFSITSVNNSTSDMYLPTGDVIVPVNALSAGSTAAQQASVVKPLTVQVVFVLNTTGITPALCAIIPNASTWQQNSRVLDINSGLPSGSYYTPRQRTIGGFTILGDVVDNAITNPGFTGNRVIAAVNSMLVLNLSSQFMQQAADITISLSGISEIDPGTVWRSDPYANFASCGIRTLANPAANCAVSFVFFDLLTPDVVAACCAGTSGVSYNCGNNNTNTPDAPVYSGAQGASNASTAACNNFITQFTGSIISDPNAQAYIATRSGELDSLVSSVCLRPDISQTQLCACERKYTYDPSIPVSLQAILANNPQCSNPGCGAGTGSYQNQNIAGRACTVNYQACLSTVNTNNAGQITQGLKLNQTLGCQQLVSQAAGGSPATTTTTNTTPNTNGSLTFPSAPGAPVAPPSIPTATTGTSSSSSSKTLLYVGIAVGVVLLILLILYLSRRSSRNTHT